MLLSWGGGWSHHVSLASLELGVLLFLDFWYDRSASHLTLAAEL